MNSGVLYSAVSLSKKQVKKLTAVVSEKLRMPIEIEVQIDERIIGGYKLLVDDVLYDFTISSGLEQFKSDIADFKPSLGVFEIGTVLNVGDGIAFSSGLGSVMSMEIVEISSGSFGMVQNLAAKRVGIVLFGDFSGVTVGDEVRRTGRIMSVPVGDALLRQRC